MPSNSDFLYRVVICTLAAVILSAVLVLLVGLFDSRIDNKEIFAILGHAFDTVIGCFVGILGGKAMNREGDK